MKRLCVVTAAEIEFKTVAALLGERALTRSALTVCRGRAGAWQVTLLKTEIGAPGFAEKLAAHLAVHRYDGLLVAGLCGALDPALRTGDAVLYERCFDGRAMMASHTDVAAISCAADFTAELFAVLDGTAQTVLRGAGVTMARIVTEADDKRALWERCGAAAVDMETYEVLAVCAEFAQPAAALRIVIDEALSELPDFNRGLDAQGRMSLGRTAVALLARPLAATRFLKTLRPSVRSLRRAMQIVLGVET